MRPSPRVRSSSPFGLAAVLFALGSCASPEPAATQPTEGDVIRDRVVEIHEAKEGVMLGFARSQRRVTIHPQHSPRAEAMVALAREALANGREVAATIDADSSGQKGDDGPPFWVVALAWAESGR